MEKSARQATRLDAIHGRYDPWLLFVSAALACVGVVMVGSASLGVAATHAVDPFYFLTRHLIFLGIGLG
ncbi:cell division protein FtsW, partial [Lysobacter sp. 2RAB21]